jgi:hypothetical protein
MFGKHTTASMGVEAQAQSLALGWMRHFQQQDKSLLYTKAETAHFRLLEGSPRILLVGIIDAEGDDFFSEYKTASPRGQKTWKKEWLLSTQALTYGLLTQSEKRFLVRKAFKLATPVYDHEWFAFDPRDLEMWLRQVQLIGREIVNYNQNISTPWPLNTEHGCFAYGPNYPCYFWQSGCTKHNFDGPIPGSVDFENFPEFTGDNKLALTNEIALHKPDIVLSSTRIKTWQRCREMYRRLQTLAFPPSEAMILGSRFHELIAAYNRTLIAKRLQITQ